MDYTKEELKETIHKSFVVRKVIADAFRDACHRAGVSQASVIKQAMIDYIALHPDEDAETTFSTPSPSQEN